MMSYSNANNDVYVVMPYYDAHNDTHYDAI